jgi:hypothetical protein
VVGNIARIVFKIVTAPILQWSPYAVTEKIMNLSKWQVEYADTPAAVLSATTGKGHTQYGVAGFKPSWILEVVIKDGTLIDFNQVPFSEDIECQGYTAISYDMESAVQLSKEDGFTPAPPANGRKYSLVDKQSIAKYLLILYCSARQQEVEQDRESRREFVWLDEYCLSDQHSTSDIESERRKELGRLADIFRYAAQVVVFCHRLGCDHTDVTCPWGNRIWTIPEILHAQKVLRMTREHANDQIITRIFTTPGRVFREAVQTKAAEKNEWHL